MTIRISLCLNLKVKFIKTKIENLENSYKNKGSNPFELISFYKSAREDTENICKPLEIEDYVIQTTEDISPPKWHLGHTSWYFETFLLQKYKPGYKTFNELFNFIFNSYYETIGNRVKRSNRGALSRPTVKEIYEYRRYVDNHMLELLESPNIDFECVELIELGLNHEQQHQELLITDIKNIFASNPLKPIYNNLTLKQSTRIEPLKFIEIKGGVHEIGSSNIHFSFDNEKPKHKVLINDFKLHNRLITNNEYLEFINDGGYSDHRLWLSDGWDKICNENWNSPLYWEKLDDEWLIMTLSGQQKLNPFEPVCHVSFYEADAFSRWSKKRLPTEAEWEIAAQNQENKEGNFLENNNFHPIPNLDSKTKLSQMFGDTWEWTASAYLPYPGYKQPEGVFGEYNGKFMSNQMVLRGGSCATPKNHIRETYRNFFQCDKRWQFSGIRLVETYCNTAGKEE